MKNNIIKVGSDFNKVVFYEIPEIVKVRVNNCNIIEFQEFLKKHKKINNKKISEILNIPKTEVEHWFRTDKYFTIPNENIWMNLKKILNIDDNKYDDFVMQFEEKESIHEQSNRVYDINGIAPTLTSTNADLRIII